MNTIIAQYDKDHRDPEVMRRAAEILRAGGLVAFPTETVYGLGGDALNPEASARIYAAKGRPSDNPLIGHIAEKEAIGRITSGIPEKAEILMSLLDKYKVDYVFIGSCEYSKFEVVQNGILESMGQVVYWENSDTGQLIEIIMVR